MMKIVVLERLHSLSCISSTEENAPTSFPQQNHLLGVTWARTHALNKLYSIQMDVSGSMPRLLPLRSGGFSLSVSGKTGKRNGRVTPPKSSLMDWGQMPSSLSPINSSILNIAQSMRNEQSPSAMEWAVKF